jgi:hypothetical protein
MPSINPPKGTRYLELIPEKIHNIWLKLSQISGLFDDYMKNSPDMFFARVKMPNSIWLERTDGNGILYLTDVMIHLSASAHMVYWDRRLSGRENFTMDCLRWAMEHADLKKINLYLPGYARAARHFADKLGFKREGEVRRWSYSEGKLFDIVIYGMTREEAFNGTIWTERGKLQSDEPNDGAVTELDAGANGPDTPTGAAGRTEDGAEPGGHGEQHRDVRGGPEQVLPGPDAGDGPGSPAG